MDKKSKVKNSYWGDRKSEWSIFILDKTLDVDLAFLLFGVFDKAFSIEGFKHGVNHARDSAQKDVGVFRCGL